MMRSLLLISLLCLSASADRVIRALPELQVGSGGFHEIGTELADIEATSSALFLSALYGQASQINSDDAAQFVQSLQSATDFGYGKAVGVPSSLEATRLALLSYLHLGREIPNAAQTGEYIRSLFNVNNGLFASQVGGEGDLKATALAVDALSVLGELKKPVVQEMLKRTKDLLQERVVEEEGNARFVLDPESQTPVSDNYFGISLAKQSGFVFGDQAKWVNFILSMQDTDELSTTHGGFFVNIGRTVVTAEATAHAAQSLYLLEHDLAERAYPLLKYAHQEKLSIVQTSQSHLAIAHTSLFKSMFRIRIAYEPVEEDRTQFVQGVQVTPHARVTVFEGTVVHGGFQIDVTESKGWKSRLEYNSNSQHYASLTQFDTSSRLGEVTFSYNLRASVYPIGEIHFTHEDTNRIGFRMAVEESAVFGGRSLEEGDAVHPGTEFSFKLALSTIEQPSILSGNFDVNFSVIDASGVTQSSETLSGKGNKAPFVFSYTLTGVDFPTGAVQFLIEITDSDGVHTARRITKAFEQQMVASHVTLQDSYSLGSTLSVTMQPGSLKDMQTVAPFSKTHASKRNFVMDISSAQGVTVLTIPGQAVESADVSQYKFETRVPVSLDFIGENVVSFRFVPESPERATVSAKLLPFDAASNGLYEDASALKFAVNAELHLSDVESKPTQSKFTYGSSIPLKFKVKDSVSGEYLSLSKIAKLSVSLKSRSSEFESNKVVVKPEQSVFEVTVDIDANTLAGDASIVVTAESVDEVRIPVLAESTKEPAHFDITIGGSIDVTSNAYSTASADSTKSAVIVTFALACEDKPLANARLFATLLRQDGSSFTPVSSSKFLSVAKDTSATGSGSRYSASVVVDHADAKSGQYKLAFRRGVDLEQSADPDTVAPLFEVSLAHKQVETGGFFIYMEVVTMLILGALFFGIQSHVVLFDRQKTA